MGAYTACLDLALGVGTPAPGLVAGRSELADVFLVSAVVVSCSAFIILHVMHRASPSWKLGCLTSLRAGRVR
jgi:predicted MFS family arabinose efflux permease